MAKTGPQRGTKNFSQKGFTKNFLSLMKTQEQEIECCFPPAQSADVQVFGSPTTAGAFTWKKPNGAKFVLVQMFGAGGAGSIGGAVTTGGSGGGYGEIWYPASMLPDTVTITVGQGGQTSAGSGGNSSFDNFIFVRGGGGAAAPGAGFPFTAGTASIFNNGGSGGTGNGVFTPRGGCSGAGGGATTGSAGLTGGFNTAANPTLPGNSITGWILGNAGGTPGSAGFPGVNGGDGKNSPLGSIIAGSGGGGGGAANTTGANNRGGNGGQGGFPGGGGGGGGFSAVNVGSFGKGGNGTVIVTTIF